MCLGDKGQSDSFGYFGQIVVKSQKGFLCVFSFPRVVARD